MKKQSHDTSETVRWNACDEARFPPDQREAYMEAMSRGIKR